MTITTELIAIQYPTICQGCCYHISPYRIYCHNCYRYFNKQQRISLKNTYYGIIAKLICKL